MKRYRAAILGTGGIAHAHAQGIQDQGARMELVAAMDVDASRAKAFCEKHAIPACFTDAAELLRQARPDMVSIATPPGTHCDLVVKALENGAWAFCEKPLVGSLAELDCIEEAERRTGRYCNCITQWRSSSSGKHIKRLVAEGAFGRPLVGVCHILWYRAPSYYQVPWRGKWETELGGTSMGHGIHAMDFFLWILGDWAEVDARIGTLDRAIRVEDCSMALVRLENGAMASIVSSALSPREESYVRMDFQKATVELKHLYGYGNANWTITPVNDPDKATDVDAWRAFPDEDVHTSHGALLASVLESMDRRERPPVSGPESRRIVEFLSCFYKSAATGRPVKRGTLQAGDPFYQRIYGTLAGA